MSKQRSMQRLRLKVRTVAVAATVTVAALTAPAVSHAAAPPPRQTVVLVHGAWADSSSWDGVVARLIRAGYRVQAFPTPLRSLTGDSSALRRFLHTISGSIVLVGHSYGGAVITNAAAGNKQITALVYVDAFAPSSGQAVITMPGKHSAIADPSVFTPVPLAAPTATTDLYVRQDVFPGAFANDLSRARGVVLAATQRPVRYGALTQKTTKVGWRTIPSWYEVGTIDKVIPSSVQLGMAKKIDAHIIRVRSGHLPMISRPAAVATTIERAASATR